MVARTSSPDTPQALDAALDGDLGWGLGVVFRAYVKGAEAALGEVPGGPRGFQVLRTALGQGCSSQGAVARRLGIDRTVMTYLLDDLEAAGLVVRSPDPHDRRARRLTVTAVGVELVDRLRGRLGHLEEQLLAGLTDDERTGLRSTVRRVAVRIDAADPVGDSCTLAEHLGR